VVPLAPTGQAAGLPSIVYEREPGAASWPSPPAPRCSTSLGEAIEVPAWLGSDAGFPQKSPSSASGDELTPSLRRVFSRRRS
jgi:hypothetical protein